MRQPRARRMRRLLALSRPVRPGFRTCRTCLVTRAEPAFTTSLGRLSTCCRKCHERDNPRHVLALRRYFKTPAGRAKRTNHHRRYMGERPHTQAIYRFRIALDRAWEAGSWTIHRYLSSLGYVSSEACVVCGAKEAPQSFWPDYAQPATWIKTCPLHRKLRAQGRS